MADKGVSTVERREALFQLGSELPVVWLATRCKAHDAVDDGEDVRDAVSKFTCDQFGALFGQLPGRHIDMGAPKQQRLPILPPLNLRLGENPARLTITRPDDAVFNFVVGRSTAHRLKEMRNDPVSILWVYSPDPVFMRFVGCLRRQTVNRQVFGRTGIAELTTPQIHCQTADLSDLLYAGKFLFAFCQSSLDLGRFNLTHPNAPPPPLKPTQQNIACKSNVELLWPR